MRGRTLTMMAVVAATLVVVGCVPGPPAATDPPPGATGPSAGCGVTAQGPVTDVARTIAVDGRTRRYTMTVPPAHSAGTDSPIPLVFDFHGLLEGAAGTHPFATQFSPTASSEGFAVVYPIGSNDGVLWDIVPQESNPDLQFIDTLLASLEESLCIDRSRVYVTGLSYGAFMTSMLMCMRANTFAAAAPVAGIRDLCTATERSVPFVTFHGTADWILPFELFGDTPQALATKYGCGDPTTATLLPAPDPATGGAITRTAWDCSAVGSAAESYRIEGGGHSWPGSWFFGLIGFIVGPTATSLDATDVIWDFFTEHHL
jgi:polyhydroxybutyrate depolymerase